MDLIGRVCTNCCLYESMNADDQCSACMPQRSTLCVVHRHGVMHRIAFSVIESTGHMNISLFLCIVPM